MSQEKNQGANTESETIPKLPTVDRPIDGPSQTQQPKTTPLNHITQALFNQLQTRHRTITKDRLTDGSITLGYEEWQQKAYEGQTHLRSAMQYLRDMIDYFGYTPVHDPITGETHDVSVIFEDPFENGRHAVKGHLGPKLQLQQLIRGYASDLGDQRALLFVGPTATGKTNFQTILAKGLEAYSRTTSGIIPRVSWVLQPGWQKRETTLGFNSSETQSAAQRWRSKKRDDIALLTCPNNDHPFTLLDRLSRREMITSIQKNKLLQSANTPLFSETDKEQIRRRHRQYTQDQQDKDREAHAEQVYRAQIRQFLSSRALDKRIDENEFIEHNRLEQLLTQPLLSEQEVRDLLREESDYTRAIANSPNRADRGLLLRDHESHLDTFLMRDPDRTRVPRVEVSRALLYGTPCNTCREIMERLQEEERTTTLESLDSNVLVRNLVLWDGRGIAYEDHQMKKNPVSEHDMASRGLSLEMRPDSRRANLLLVHDDAGKQGLSYIWDVVQGDPALRNRVDVMSMNTADYVDISEKLRDANQDFSKAIARRIQVIHVGYLLTTSDEAQIYEEQVTQIRKQRKHIEPHTIRLAADFAVWTRLQHPDPKNYTREGVSKNRYTNITDHDIERMEESKKHIDAFLNDLTPDKKARLLDGDASFLLPSERHDVCLDVIIKIMRQEFEEEGRYGLSPSNVRDTLLDLADSPAPSIGAYEVYHYWIDKAKPRTSRTQYFDIGHESNEIYGRPHRLLHLMKTRFLEITQSEFEQVILGDTEDVHAKFSKYVDHVKAQTFGEKVSGTPWNPQPQEPSEEYMARIEELIGVDRGFRQGVMTQVGAWSLDNPGQEPDYGVVFGHEMERLRRNIIQDSIPDGFYRHLSLGFALQDEGNNTQLLWTNQVFGTTHMSELYRQTSYPRDERDKSYHLASTTIRQLVGTYGYSTPYAIRIVLDHLKHLGLDKS